MFKLCKTGEAKSENYGDFDWWEAYMNTPGYESFQPEKQYMYL